MIKKIYLMGEDLKLDLPQKFINYFENCIIPYGHEIIIMGDDENDLCLQIYLSNIGYDNIVIYAPDLLDPNYNLGRWTVKNHKKNNIQSYLINNSDLIILINSLDFDIAYI